MPWLRPSSRTTTGAGASRPIRVFEALLLAQWNSSSIVLAAVISPFTWAGNQLAIHSHTDVRIAAVVGGLVCALPA